VKKLRFIAYCFISMVLVAMDTSAVEPRFEGHVVVEWLQHDGDDRLVRLVEPFAFVDKQKKVWSVPKGAVVDGASIPRVLWTLVGPPFVGDYRYASVVHDYYCDTKSESWRATHRMFLEASLLGGVESEKAKVMYAAVYARGPRWESVTTIGLEGPETLTYEVDVPIISDKQLDEISNYIYENDPSLEEIESRIDNPRP